VAKNANPVVYTTEASVEDVEQTLLHRRYCAEHGVEELLCGGFSAGELRLWCLREIRWRREMCS